MSAPATQIFESVARQEGLAGFRIWELDAAGEARPAFGRAAYYPILYVDPLSGNESTLGYDLGSDPAGARALARASTEGATYASDPLRLLQSMSPGWGMLLVEPVANRDSVHRSATESPLGQAQQGYVVGVLRWERLLEAAANASNGSASLVALDVVDLQSEGSGVPLLLATTEAEPDPYHVGDAGQYDLTGVDRGHVMPDPGLWAGAGARLPSDAGLWRIAAPADLAGGGGGRAQPGRHPDALCGHTPAARDHPQAPGRREHARPGRARGALSRAI